MATPRLRSARIISDLATARAVFFASMLPTRRCPLAHRAHRAERGSQKCRCSAPVQQGDGVEHIEGKDLTLIYEGRSAFTLSLVERARESIRGERAGPCPPDAMPVDALVESRTSARRARSATAKDGNPDETAHRSN